MARIDFNTRELSETITKKFEQLVRKVVLDGMRQLIRQSPVDTGRFKANWSTSITNIDSSEKEMAGTRTPQGSLSSIADYQRSAQGISTYKLGQTAFLHNNLEYALPLEYGTSKQAPVGWIRNTAKEMQSQFDRIKSVM